MRKPDPLDDLLREWKSPEPSSELDQRVTSAYRSTIHPANFWRRFWRMRVSVPAPALVATPLAVFVLFFWLRSATPTAAPEMSGVFTRLSVSGFQPLPNGQARKVSAMEILK